MGQRRSLRIGFALALAALLMAGCSKPEDKFVGHYTGKVQITPQAEKALSALPKQAQAQTRSQLQSLNVALDLKKDKAYTVSMSLPDGAYTGTGTWSLTDNKISLVTQTETSNGKTVTVTNKGSDVLTVGPDPKVLTMDSASNPELAGLNVSFTKSD